MTAEAIARLRVAATLDEAVDFGGVRVRLADLRAMLDRAALEAAHREVTDLTGDLTPEALTRLSDVQGYVRCGDRATLGVDYERGIAEGERRERARVVADLRKLANGIKGGFERSAPEVLEKAADRYERGEHESEGT